MVENGCFFRRHSLGMPLTLQNTDESMLGLSSKFNECPFAVIEDIFSLWGEAAACTKEEKK